MRSAPSSLTRWARYRSFALGEQVLAELREDFVDNALALPIGTVERAGTGDLLSRTSRDVDTLSRTVRFAVPETIIAFVTVLFTVVATLGVIMAAVYLLWMFQKVYLGPVEKEENKKLREQNRKLRERDIHTLALAAQVPGLLRLLHFVQGPRFPNDYRAINTAVISPQAGPFAHTLAIEAGSSSGVRLNSPVVSGPALVGIVTNVFPDSAVVTLLTDPNTYVPAVDPQTSATTPTRRR